MSDGHMRKATKGLWDTRPTSSPSLWVLRSGGAHMSRARDSPGVVLYAAAHQVPGHIANHLSAQTRDTLHMFVSSHWDT